MTTGWPLVGAAAVVVHVALLTIRVLRSYRSLAPLRRPAMWLSGLVVLQPVLGLGTWMVKYASPFESFSALRGFTIEADGMAQARTITAHTAGGSLILAVCSARSSCS